MVGQKAHITATARSRGTPPEELVERRVIELGKDALLHLTALADERNVDLQTLANEAFADLLKKHGRGRPDP